MAIYFDPNEIEFGLELEELPDGEYEPKLPNLGKIQRRKITGPDRTDAMVIYGVRDQTIHGKDAAGKPCTLIVFHWYVNQRKDGKRIKNLHISVVFVTERKSGGAIDHFYDPDVRAVAPAGTYSMLPTDTSVEEKKALEGSLDAAFGGAKAALKAVYELNRSKVTTDRITIDGRLYSEYRKGETGDPDRCNAVEWHLFENKSQKSGIPTFFRTTVLLERRSGDMQKFTAAFDVRMEVDVWTDAKRWVKKVFGFGVEDAPVIFDPMKVEQNRFGQFENKLDAVPLDNECKFVMYIELPTDLDAEAKAQGKGTSTEKGEDA